MIGDDRVVFVDDRTGAEVLLGLDVAHDVLDELLVLGEGGEVSNKSASIFLDALEVGRAIETVEYFQRAAKVPLDEQLSQITVIELDPGDDLAELFRKLGLS
jgi:hypothetical protein